MITKLKNRFELFIAVTIPKVLKLRTVKPSAKIVADQSYRKELMDEMQIAMDGFTKALQKYEADIKDGAPSVANSQMLFSSIEVYREHYLKNRLRYEHAFGKKGKGNYNELLEESLRWTEEMKERKLICLFRHPLAESKTATQEVASSLDQPIS